eukprot:3852005-Pleurochrysis_carterae.AAC.1
MERTIGKTMTSKILAVLMHPAAMRQLSMKSMKSLPMKMVAHVAAQRHPSCGHALCDFRLELKARSTGTRRMSCWHRTAGS